MLFCIIMLLGGSVFLYTSGQQAGVIDVSADSETMVYPCGFPVGIYLRTKGVMVIGTAQIPDANGNMHEPAAGSIVSGDYILSMNGEGIESKEDFQEMLNWYGENPVTLEIEREGQSFLLSVQAVRGTDGNYRLGIWVKDSIQGLGTVTYLTLNGEFGALGHGIHDSETNELIDIAKGSVYNTNIVGIQKGVKGEPGGLEGVIIYRSSNKLGVIDDNTENGIHGSISDVEKICEDMEPVEICKKDDIQLGKASILCCVNGTVEEYEIRIKNTDSYAKDANKGIIIEVTDEKLLELTGGIVQGMSGSPILQNGKIVGAVTHVLVNDPTRGYGIFIEDMLKQ